jgi:hypothetical protein
MTHQAGGCPECGGERFHGSQHTLSPVGRLFGYRYCRCAKCNWHGWKKRTHLRGGNARRHVEAAPRAAEGHVEFSGDVNVDLVPPAAGEPDAPSIEFESPVPEDWELPVTSRERGRRSSGVGIESKERARERELSARPPRHRRKPTAADGSKGRAKSEALMAMWIALGIVVVLMVISFSCRVLEDQQQDPILKHFNRM